MRAVFFVSNNPHSYSGGRYHAMLMAEAIAAAGHEVTVCTNHVPVFFEEFADLPGHRRVELLLSKRFGKTPRGEVDVVVVVPQSSPAPWLYDRALLFARRRNARVVLLNFESPNWFNAYSPKPRDEHQWDGWVEVSRAADLILSSTAESTKYARQFYRDVPGHALFRQAYPAINSPTADSVAPPPKRKQIICITRCQPGDVHKGGWELTKAFSPAIRGYTLLLLVGFGQIGKDLLGELEARAAQYGAKIEVAYRLTDQEKFRRIKQSELMLFLSQFEGYGYPPVEARYCNVPCVVYDLPVLREVSGDDLLYVPRGDEEGLRSAVTAVLRGRRRPEQPSFREAPPIATFERYVARLEELHKELQALAAPPAASVAARRLVWRWRKALYRSRLRYLLEAPCKPLKVAGPWPRAKCAPLMRRIRIAVWPVVLLAARLMKHVSPEFVEWVKVHVFRIRDEGRRADAAPAHSRETGRANRLGIPPNQTNARKDRMKIVAMIPARMGSQRLKQKNLCELGGEPLIVRAIRKCRAAGVFDEIWVNSEHPAFGEIAAAEGVGFHRRPEHLGSNTATSEQFVYEFLQKHPCDYLFQVHSIAPLLTAGQVGKFVDHMTRSDCDVMLSCILEQIECALDGKPVNFRFDAKTNSQDLAPVQRITWSITAWRRETYMAAYEAGMCATYAGKVGLFPVDRISGHVIKTEEDLKLAEALLPLVEGAENAASARHQLDHAA